MCDISQVANSQRSWKRTISFGESFCIIIIIIIIIIILYGLCKNHWCKNDCFCEWLSFKNKSD